MQVHLFSGKWIKPVTPEGTAALQGWKPDRRITGEADPAV